MASALSQGFLNAPVTRTPKHLLEVRWFITGSGTCGLGVRQVGVGDRDCFEVLGLAESGLGVEERTAWTWSLRLCSWPPGKIRSKSVDPRQNTRLCMESWGRVDKSRINEACWSLLEQNSLHGGPRRIMKVI